MNTPNTSVAGPSLLVVIIGALWGLYWVPIRRLEAVLSTGPWLTFAVVCLGCLGLVPFAWMGRRRLRDSNKRALLSTALGGASFVLYSNGLLYGQVAVVILLFYLTPVWSTLIGRFWMKWPTSPWRYLAIVLGLAGIGMVLSGSHNGLPLPRTLGDVLGLTSGILWSIAATGINVHSRTRAAETNFVFCAGGAGMALILGLCLAPGGPGHIGLEFGLEAWGWMACVGLVWWAVSLTGFMWATRRLEPARVGILLMSEVIVGAITAGLFAGEPFSGIMIMGAALVMGAAVIETVSKPYYSQPGRGVPQEGLQSSA